MERQKESTTRVKAGLELVGQHSGISIVQCYQPGDRFWTFQTIENGILLVLTTVLLGFAVYWVTRRVS